MNEMHKRNEGLAIMNLKAEGSYLLTMMLAKQLLSKGIITKPEFKTFKAKMEEKYKPKISTVFT